MKESIFDIAKAINRHRELELTTETRNTAVGRSKTLYDGEEKQFWLIDGEGTVTSNNDWNGNIVTTTAYQKDKPYSKNGFTVPKRSLLASILIQNTEGIHTYKTPMGEKKIEIFNRAIYEPSISGLAENILIRLANDGQQYSYQVLDEILKLKKSLEETEKKVEDAQEKNNQEEVAQLLEELDLKRKQFDEQLANAKNFIRRHAELRYQPILDPVQDKIKSSNIFNGKLIINGGPGTGKTTSLIQRIKFLTSASIDEFVKLNAVKKQILSDQKKNWIFFTPNELLSLFLRNSMIKEDLAASNETVKVWQNHKSFLIKEYKLSNTTTQKPFRFYNHDIEKTVLPSTAAKLMKFEKKFETFFLSLQKQKLDRVKDLDTSKFVWKRLGEEIKRDVNNYSEGKMSGVMQLFLNLEDKYAEQAKILADEFNILTKEAAGRILNLIKQNETRYTELTELLKNENVTEDEDEDEDDEIERENFEENVEDLKIDVDLQLMFIIRSLIRKNALKQFDSTVKFSAKNKKYLEKLKETGEGITLEKIGEIAFFRKYFERLTKGIIPNIYREISASYKKFRRNELKSISKMWDLKIIEKLVTDKNSRLHTDEQAFLLFFINKLNIQLAKNFRNIYINSNHPFIEAFRQNCKAVIGIDEATDFRLIDLLCMSTFNHPDFDSVTLSGDMMQKLTKDGLNSWKDYLLFNKKTEIHNLEISYRQSQTLLSLAQDIYRGVNKTDAVYRSFIDKSEFEPLPLLFVSPDQHEKIKWMVDRILEIHESYSFIPSIAVFVPDENQLEKFANDMGSFDELSDVGIQVKACRDGEVLGDKNTIRIFSIDKIKGLEFDTVFFHNADEILKAGVSTEMFYKFMYVGLSRASFYLGMTLNEKLPTEIEFIAENFSTNQNWK